MPWVHCEALAYFKKTHMPLPPPPPGHEAWGALGVRHQAVARLSGAFHELMATEVCPTLIRTLTLTLTRTPTRTPTLTLTLTRTLTRGLRSRRWPGGASVLNDNLKPQPYTRHPNPNLSTRCASAQRTYTAAA